MVILTENHINAIHKISNVLSVGDYHFGGSLEDYGLLGEVTTPVGDLDVIILNPEMEHVVRENFTITSEGNSYYNNLMSDNLYKIVSEIDGIKIDFLIHKTPKGVLDISMTTVDGMDIPCRSMGVKIKFFNEVIENSRFRDEWAYDKMNSILKRYEDSNNK